MKPVRILWFLIPLLLAPTLNAAAASTRTSEWASVTNAIARGLPKTALELLAPVEAAALRDESWGEAGLAVATRIQMEVRIQGNQPAERVRRWSAAEANAPLALRPLFRALLAHAYRDYLVRNRWRIHQRTAGSSSDDFETWDLQRLYAEVDRQFTRALESPAHLRAIPIAGFQGLLTAGSLPDAYRPTLYDFLAHEALEFYLADDPRPSLPEESFELLADGPILGETASFLRWDPGTRDAASPRLKAVRLFQELLKFHQQDADQTAFLDVDLARLQMGGNLAVGLDRERRYLESLDRFIDRARDHPVSSMSSAYAARALLRADQPDQAHARAKAGAERFPESPGGNACTELVDEIEQASLRIRTEGTWTKPWPPIEIHHKNLPSVTFRVVATEWNQFLQRSRSRPEQPNNTEREALLRERPALEWTVPLPPTPDFREKQTLLNAPESLRPGFYFLLASRRPDFAQSPNEITFTPFWVSDLALVVRSRAGAFEGLVVDADSGLPLRGAKVESWHLDARGERIPAAPRSTDDDGAFRFEPNPDQRSTLFKATLGDRAVALGHELWQGGLPPASQVEEQTLFFTDRAIYRPHQLIQYKGICLRADASQSRYQTLANQKIVVLLRDANGSELGRATHSVNDYGSFNGSFTAPGTGLSGALSLVVEQGPDGMAVIQVEEYKRPKFQVTVHPPATPPRLTRQIQVQGRATTYTGAAVDGASVTWRVVREIRLPFWRWGRYGSWPGSGDSQEIAHGRATTDAEGAFSIAFTTTPDLKVPESDRPVFRYHVHTDVTDGAGETRSAERVLSVGYAAIEAGITADEWLSRDADIRLSLTTKTLDGDGASSRGMVRIHRLEQPPRVERRQSLDVPPRPMPGFRPWSRGTTLPIDPGSPLDSWKLREQLTELPFEIGTNGTATVSVKLPVGAFRAVLETQDSEGKRVTAEKPLLILDPQARQLDVRVPMLVVARSWTVEPGSTFEALWGTGYPTGRAFVEVEHQHRLIRRFWTSPDATQQTISHALADIHRGGVTVHITFIRENRAYIESHRIDVPWSNKAFDIEWGTHRSRLEPGQKERWTATLRPSALDAGTTRKGSVEALNAEMVATLYDASLDAFLPFSWPERFQCFPSDFSTAQTFFSNSDRWLSYLLGRQPPRRRPSLPTGSLYRQFHEWAEAASVPRFRGRGESPMTFFAEDAMEPRSMAQSIAAAPGAEMAVAAMAKGAPAGAGGDVAGRTSTSSDRLDDPSSPRPRISPPPTRRNLQETAFFFPHLRTDDQGVVRMEFEMPEALTEWRFLGFAHDRQLRAGLLEGHTVTARDLMVQPNPPRFLREGDEVEFTAKIVNASSARLAGQARMQLRFAADDRDANSLLRNSPPTVAFDVPAKESRVVRWSLTVPDGCGFLVFKVTAESDRFSDGEEGWLPVVSRRVFLTESLPLAIRGPGIADFNFEALEKAATSRSLVHEGLTLQVASNPAWYAVLALPYLMEYPHECAEQVFNRFYANALAGLLTRQDPRLEALFARWRGTEALQSPLEKNSELKSIAIEATPWLRQAKSETEARRNLAVLFDQNRLASEAGRATQQLRDLQTPEGGWPWFAGGRTDPSITLYIVAGLGRMRTLRLEVPMDLSQRAITHLDQEMHRRWVDAREVNGADAPRLSPWIALYLYARSFFLPDVAVAPPHRESFEQWVNQAQRHWVRLDHRQSQGHLALALHRLGKDGSPSRTAAAAILASLKERSVHTAELGMHWRDDELSASWFRAPIETQALMIEAFAEVGSDPAAVEELKVWLLKQKQARDWKTTKATADAVYALLRQGTDLLANRALVRISAGGRDFTPPSDAPRAATPTAPPNPTTEPGTGFYEVRIPASEIRSQLATLRLSKAEPGIAWGGAHWQYFETIENVRPARATPLTVTKGLFVRSNSPTGRKLTPLEGAAKVGDELVVRMELRVDRDLEYVHLRDSRGSGTEPVNVLSGYRFQDGLAYYESTRDVASHFFISYLAKGTYVFEYSVRVQLRGHFATGPAEAQCLYAPEFNGRSASLPLEVR
ncbi:MAG: hypothetical protein JNK85_18710 [Verrucomicrobiales bacterium]|nr:hypothetical protein [Verrucomicrobiales bacterium]